MHQTHVKYNYCQQACCSNCFQHRGCQCIFYNTVFLFIRTWLQFTCRILATRSSSVCRDCTV